MQRRDTLKLLTAGATLFMTGLLYPARVLAKWNDKAFSAQNLQAALDAYYPGLDIIPSDRINIGVRPEIENGAVVPVKIDTDLPAIESIAIFVENNPNPLIANFDLSPVCKGFVSTRIKMDGPSDILVVVVSNGQPFSSKTFVEVHEGGCG